MTGRAQIKALRRGASAACLAAILVAAFGGTTAVAQTLVADLSKRLVAITTGFAGTDVLLFGAIDEAADVVVVVRGPEGPLVMHRKSRVLGIWVNTAQMTFERVPSFYLVASSGPLEDIAREPVRTRHELGVENLRLDLPPAKASPNVAREWRQGLIRNYQRQGLYAAGVTPITFLGNRLFRTEVHLPANVPTGPYQVLTYMLRDGHVVSAQTMPLFVSKVGTEAVVFDFAHQYSAYYGLIAIFIALVAGWLAHLAFRKS
jgi:uncharacterized protein (TIGR02186 family)